MEMLDKLEGIQQELIRSKTDAETARDELEDTYNRLKSLERLKDGLTHMIVHDLNNSLAVVAGSVDLMRMQGKDSFTEEESRFIDLAHSGCEELKGMIEDVLDINKMEEDRLALNIGNFSLADAAREIVDQMRVVPRHKGLDLSAQAPVDLPAASADEKLIRRVIVNLIGNALKFTPNDGAVEVKVMYKKDDATFYIQVKDTGAGIPQEYLDKIFDKFMQVGSEKTKTGRGMGLTFCRMAIEAHGGKIWVESEQGQGSTFIFTLPQRP